MKKKNKGTTSILIILASMAAILICGTKLKNREVKKQELEEIKYKQKLEVEDEFYELKGN